MKSILVSACLLGVSCRYDGKAKPVKEVIALKEKYNLIPVCAEIMGGLPTPRPPAEIVGGRVINTEGKDVTAEYFSGAENALRLAKERGVTLCILKAKSPSCGSGKVYDGSFTGTLIDGDGVTARLLKEKGFRVISEVDL